MLLGMAIGVAAVILLTALGDSARRYVTGEFAELGTNLVVVLPGRSETTGGPPPLLGETPRDLTIDDAMALLRSHNIKRVAPIMVGSAPVGAAQCRISVISEWPRAVSCPGWIHTGPIRCVLSEKNYAGNFSVMQRCWGNGCVLVTDVAV